MIRLSPCAAVFGSLVVFAGCYPQAGVRAQAPSPKVPKDREAIIASFQSQALAALPQKMTADNRKFAITAINNRKRTGAHRKTWDVCFRRIDGTLSSEERKSLLLYGAIDDLKKRSGECWDVTSFGGRLESVSGYIDATTGKLILLWIVPEG